MAHVAATSSLVNQVVKRLGGMGDPYKPYLVENVIRQTKSLHVTAIWDAWGNMDRRNLDRLILLDAYQAAERHPQLTITVALGLTVAEAIHLGLLPFKLVPTFRNSDPVDPAEIKRVARGLKLGFYVEGNWGFQIRFHTEDEAEDAFRAVMQRFGGKPYWAIAQELDATPSLGAE